MLNNFATTVRNFVKLIAEFPNKIWILSGLSYTEEQEAQLLQRDGTILHVIKYFTKSLHVTRNDTLE